MSFQLEVDKAVYDELREKYTSIGEYTTLYIPPGYLRFVKEALDKLDILGTPPCFEFDTISGKFGHVSVITFEPPSVTRKFLPLLNRILEQTGRVCAYCGVVGPSSTMHYYDQSCKDCKPLAKKALAEKKPK
jgi:hypothetical protein